MAKKHYKTTARLRILGSFIFGIALVVATLLIGKIVISHAYNHTEQIVLSEAARIKNPQVSKIELTVTDTTTLDDIAQQLAHKGIISDRNYFVLEAKLEDQSDAFVPGDYTISSNMSTTQILSLLTAKPDDEEDVVKFTIPEGYTVEQIAETLESEKIISKADFLKAANTKDFSSAYAFLRELPPSTDYKCPLEGYLFPDTYIVRKNASAEEIIVKMLNRFGEIYSHSAAYTHNTPYSTHELITIASIIEQEAKLDEERTLISGVIYNRLDKGMPLQMCSTVQYSLNKRKTSLTYADLQQAGPYNTYLNAGLPIGPICNPGEACIKAAIFPDANDYYYFVVKDPIEGSHCFSSTLEEHNSAKALYKQSSDINFTE